MQEKPQKEHDWLQRLVGEWTYESDFCMEPGKEPWKSRGSESVSSLGGLWTIGEGLGEMPGGGIAKSIMTLGFDPAKKRFVGTFIASMMTHLWVYEGEIDGSGNRLTLDTLGPSFCGDRKMIAYQDVIEFKNNDHRVLSSYSSGPNGTWINFMTAQYRRSR